MKWSFLRCISRLGRLNAWVGDGYLLFSKDAMMFQKLVSIWYQVGSTIGEVTMPPPNSITTGWSGTNIALGNSGSPSDLSNVVVLGDLLVSLVKLLF